MAVLKVLGFEPGHVMALVEQLCDHVGVIAKGRLAAAGTLEVVRGRGSLEDAFVRLVGARSVVFADVEPNTVVAGNPARVVRRLSEEEMSRGH